MNGWHETTKAAPCPVCGKAGWCGTSDDGRVVHCMRVQSNRPCVSGGWFHFMFDRERPAAVPVPRRPPARRLLDAERVMAGFRDEFERPDLFDSLLEIADDLGLAACHVDRLLVGRSAMNGAWAFPMRDGDGKVVGIRLRRYRSSDKWSVGGSADGLFYDPDLEPERRVHLGIADREIVVVEGATDCIAAYSIGLPAVGRSSCGTGAAHLCALCSRLGVRRVTIVSDNDRAKYTEGTATAPPRLARPGQDGARRLAKALGREFRIVVPPAKDLREWVARGLTADGFWSVAANVRFGNARLQF